MSVQTTEMSAVMIRDRAMMSLSGAEVGAKVASDVAEVAKEAGNGTTMDTKMNIGMKTAREEEVEIDRRNGANDGRRQESAS